jgi:hypothetical protein
MQGYEFHVVFCDQTDFEYDQWFYKEKFDRFEDADAYCEKLNGIHMDSGFYFIEALKNG